ncbi:MAG: AMP-dependent synthetase [Rhodospirillaceae bacterium]|nr:AMP-dependent synthetase [Rhodospirillaceae bacterium]HAA93531.1 AMP-dependent synthetase [Rhodospirillaceae bacterium]
MANTIASCLEYGQADDIAIAAPGRASLSFDALRSHIAKTASELNARGVGRNDRVAIVLPNGPEMASAFLAVGACATTAPLNPGYRADEFDFYLSDLNAKAIVVEKGSDSPAVDVAKSHKLEILEIDWSEDDPAGTFSILGNTNDGNGDQAASGGMAEPDDTALVLHTSGTTSRPKIVPLSQTNVTASAAHIGDILSLSAADRCMNIMPLFHIHGLIAAVLSSVTAGGAVFCCPSFNALRVFSWLEEATPSWYTAVPTMHQAILSRAGRNKEILEKTSLRFIRSSSSSLPPPVMLELEETFGAPVIESYGMTEAAHQMASNQLPPGQRKPGSVGVAAGPNVEIMDDDGNIRPQGEIGEIVIRGPNVTDGYENNPTANAENFTDGWFRTGDQGMLDEDGFLQITGRLKEIINRGGEKIAPLEVDNIIQSHPAVAQTVTFAMPHPKLGEEVAAAIVLNEGAEATDQEIKDFASEKLADFKVPRKILFLDEIPKGATGKMQRIGLAEKLGLAE